MKNISTNKDTMSFWKSTASWYWIIFGNNYNVDSRCIIVSFTFDIPTQKVVPSNWVKIRSPAEGRRRLHRWTLFRPPWARWTRCCIRPCGRDLSDDPFAGEYITIWMSVVYISTFFFEWSFKVYSNKCIYIIIQYLCIYIYSGFEQTSRPGVKRVQNGSVMRCYPQILLKKMAQHSAQEAWRLRFCKVFQLNLQTSEAISGWGNSEWKRKYRMLALRPSLQQRDRTS